jgi:hypothetical protein
MTSTTTANQPRVVVSTSKYMADASFGAHAARSCARPA